MEQGLRRLNLMSVQNASEHLVRCCGSTLWVERMIIRRPYESSGELLRTAGDVWWNLAEDDWLEAFAAHPEIGDRSRASGHSDSRKWSTDEQVGAAGATSDVARRLAAGNKTYKDQFGFIFIICATGKSSHEMLRDLESRLQNERVLELQIAAEHQLEITNLRLNRLLDELEHNA